MLSAISSWKRFCQAIPAANDAWLNSKKASVAFCRQRKCSEKSNTGGPPKRFTLSEVLHRSNDDEALAD
jgi:hypothetical protein